MYLKKSDLRKEYRISDASVSKRIEGIRDQLGKRYPMDSLIHTGRILRVREDVFRDYILYEEAIACEIAPPFRPKETHVWDLDTRKETGLTRKDLALGHIATAQETEATLLDCKALLQEVIQKTGDSNEKERSIR